MKPNYPLSRNKNRFWLVGLLTITLTISCGVLELGFERDNITPIPPEFKNEIPTPDPAFTQENTHNTNQPDNQPVDTLNPTGPWLVFITGTGSHSAQIWAANPDGSGMTTLVDQAFIGGYRGNTLMPAISPNGHYLAYIEVQQEPVAAYLHIVELPSGNDNKIVMLYDETQLGYSQEILDVILYKASSIAWSPDGRKLAFIGAMEGGTADLYLHEPEENNITRLSDGPGQAYMPVWSADGKTILHTATSEFHQGAGFSPYLFTSDGLWATDAESYTNTTIPWPFGDEPKFIKYTAWHESNFIFFGQGSPCPDGNGCWMDIRNGETGPFPFPIIEFAVSPKTGGMLATYFNTTMPIDTAGAYLFTSDNNTGTRITESELDNIQWLEQAEVFAAQDINQPELKTIHFSPEGTILTSSTWPGSSLYVEMITSPDSLTTAWYRFIDEFGTGLWLESDDNEPLQHVFLEPIHEAVWTPDSERLFFTVDEFNPVPGDNTQGLYIINRDGQGLQHLFRIPTENFLTVLGFAGN